MMTPPEGPTLTGVVKEFDTGLARQEYPALAGVEVCVHEHEEVPCVSTEADGGFTLLGAPANADIVLTFEKLGYFAALRQVTTQASDYDILAETVLGNVLDAAAQAEALGVTPSVTAPPGGMIQFFGVTPGDGVLQVAQLADYSVTITQASGEPALCDLGHGPEACRPVYLDAEGLADLSLDRASSIGVGAAGIFPAGDYVFTYAHPTLSCNTHLPESGFDASTPNSIRVVALAGYITSQVGMVCQPE